VTDRPGRGGPPRRVAVAVVHGIGGQRSDFAVAMIEAIRASFRDTAPEAPDDALAFAPVHWAPVLQSAQHELTRRVQSEHDLDWDRLRSVIISFLGDGIAYEPTPHNRAVYDAVHGVMAEALHRAAAEAASDAPLCVIAHSLGSVVASNYLYDLSKPELVSDEVRMHMGHTPLERGETFTHFFSLGSPLALWALRHGDFGCPLEVPSQMLTAHHPNLTGGWLNFFDRDDVIAHPLRQLNDAYAGAVTEDVEVNAGSLLESTTPLSHNGYATDREVVDRISSTLAETWRRMGKGM